MDSRIIPSIEQLRQRPTLRALESSYGRDAVVAALRTEAELLRGQLAQHAEVAELPADRESAAVHLERQATERLRATYRVSLRRVINATGVVLHTNLGRAPLASAALDAIANVTGGYANLEYDLEAGRRGRRDIHAGALLARLTGADAAVVANNNAAATLLILTALAEGREVVISRGELVEIGGGFRVPDVMAQSGALLREVGTTNKTRIGDYEQAINDRTALILRVHRSNFRIEGFTEQPSLDELVALGRRAGIPVVEDLGSGLLNETLLVPGPVAVPGTSAPGHPVDRPGSALAPEPTVRASVAAGIDIVCFSGDKLLGGPQAGIIVGRGLLIRRIGRHPLMRALRVDKLTYAALEATLLEYAAGRAAETVPVIRMLSLTADKVRERASALVTAVGERPAFVMELRDGESMVGGGSAPGLPVPTCLLALLPRTQSATDIESALRRGDPPIIARVENDAVLLDFRTVAPEEDQTVAQALIKIGECGTSSV